MNDRQEEGMNGEVDREMANGNKGEWREYKMRGGIETAGVEGAK